MNTGNCVKKQSSRNNYRSWFLLVAFFFVALHVVACTADAGTCSKEDGASPQCRDSDKSTSNIKTSTLKVNANKHGALHLAVRSGNVETIRKLLEEPGKEQMLKEFDGSQWGNTPVHLAIVSAQPNILQILIDAGADLNGKNKADETPLTTAAANCQSRAAELLIKHGADVEKRGQFGRTPLHQAALVGCLPCLELLLSKGSDIDARDAERSSNALHMAASFGHDSVVKALLAAKPNLLNVPNAIGHTALHCACWQAHPSTVKLLLKAGANTKQPDRNGDTPYGLAYNSGKKEIVKLLQELGVRN